MALCLFVALTNISDDIYANYYFKEFTSSVRLDTYCNNFLFSIYKLELFNCISE